MSIIHSFAHVIPKPAPFRKRRRRKTQDLLEALAIPIFESLVKGEYIRMVDLANEVSADFNVVRTALGRGPSGLYGARLWALGHGKERRVQPCMQNFELMLKYLTGAGELELRRRLAMSESELASRLAELPTATRHDDDFRAEPNKNDNQWVLDTGNIDMSIEEWVKHIATETAKDKKPATKLAGSPVKRKTTKKPKTQAKAVRRKPTPKKKAPPKAPKRLRKE